MTARLRRPIVIILLTALIAAGLVGAWWFRGSTQQPMTVAQIDRNALDAADPIGQWWLARDGHIEMPGQPHEAMLFEATMFPGLASSRSSNVWAKMRRTESTQIANLPGPTATGPQITGELRTELQSLTTDVTRMSAAYDLINARHYRAAIDDWWAPYPQAQVFPVLAGGYRETLLAELPRGEITPTHLQMGDVMAQRQRRLGWAAQAEVDAVAIALRERLDRERATFESQLSTELTSRLSTLELGNSTVVSGPQITAHTILSSGGSLPPLSLSTQFADMLATHALQIPATTSRDLMATSAAEETALKNLWESYDALRDRRIDAALRGQHLTEGSGPDMTDQVGSQLFPKSTPTPVEVAP